MLLSPADLRDWVGRPAMDPYGEPLGEVSGIVADEHSGAPEWLLLTDRRDHQGRLAPVAGAVPSGRHVRVVPTAELVRGAPTVSSGEELDPETKARALAHYGLRLELEGPAAPGVVSHAAAGGDAGAGGDAAGRTAASLEGGTSRRKLIDGLRAAHAMEQASLKLLNAMRWRSSDEELVHDLALHHKATNDHAERIRVRLDELEASRARPLDWLAKLAAYVQAQRGRFRRPPEPADLAEACRFEEAEARAYRSLRELAGNAGDTCTAALCEENLADEVAMSMTLRNFRLRADPGFRRERKSPFETPRDLAEAAPES